MSDGVRPAGVSIRNCENHAGSEGHDDSDACKSRPPSFFLSLPSSVIHWEFIIGFLPSVTGKRQNTIQLMMTC